MPKKLIKKYQLPMSGITRAGSAGYDPSLAEQGIYSTNNDFLKNLNLKSSTGIKPKSYFSTMSKSINFNPSPVNATPQFKGLGNGDLTGNKATGSSLTKSGGNALGAISNIGGAVAGLGKGIATAFGAEEATIKSGATDIMNGVADAVGSLGPIGSIIGTGLKVLGVVNDLAGSKLKKQGTVGINTGAYTTQINPNAGGKLDVVNSLFSDKKKKINELTKRSDTNNILASNATYKNSTNQLAAQNSYGDVATKTQQQLQGGLRTNVLAAKKGTKVNPKQLENITNKAKRKVKKAQEGTPTDDLQKMENGGQITNVIPEGALHARLNHYDGELAEQVTSKGIPVISNEEDGKILQHAEIEHSEIIFNKKTSTQIEDWFKKYNQIKDSKEKELLEIECGKFLTHEILNNTEDNVGLLNT